VGKIWSVLALSAVLAGPARADTPAPAPEAGPVESLDQKIAVWRFEGLGIDPEIISRLEALFRVELDRLDKQQLPSRRDIDKALTPDLASCGGDEKCLVAIGKKLNVATVVTGTVATIGDSYVLDIKAVDVAKGTSQHFRTPPLQGTADDLIEGVRVAAYQLLAPGQLHGAVQVLSDLVGAQISIDDKAVGKAPLPNGGVIANQGLGKHKIHVAAAGYEPFDTEVDVHFQKVSTVDVHLLQSKIVIGTGKVVHVRSEHLYTRPWFIAAVGIAAVGLGVWIGYEAGKVPCTRFDAMGNEVGGC
jgi:hypothetical protein